MTPAASAPSLSALPAAGAADVPMAGRAPLPGLAFSDLMAASPDALPAAAAAPPARGSAPAADPAAAEATETEAQPLLSWLFGLMDAGGGAPPAAEPDAAPLPTPAAGRARAPQPGSAPTLNAEALSAAATVDDAAAECGEMTLAVAADAASAAAAASVETAATVETVQAAASPARSDAPLAGPAPVPPPAAPTAAPAAPAATPAAPGTPIPVSPELAFDLGERIVWQLDEAVSEARIELHPAELGALTVRIEMQGDQARVHIVAAEAATRALLAQALPQLRELLGGSGLNLAKSQIEAATRRDERTGARGLPPEPAAAPRRRVSAILLVDAYA